MQTNVSTKSYLYLIFSRNSISRPIPKLECKSCGVGLAGCVKYRRPRDKRRGTRMVPNAALIARAQQCQINASLAYVAWTTVTGYITHVKSVMRRQIPAIG